MYRSNRNILLFTLLAIILIAFASSCDRRNPPPVAPDVIPPPHPSELRIITKISASPDTIYSDNNITYSNISVSVKDGEGFPVFGQVVRFKSSIGRILNNVPTDSTGVATTIFWDDGDAGIAQVEALVRNIHPTIADSIISQDSANINVTIADVPSIPADGITLEMPSVLNPQPLTVMQAITVRARARNELGNDVPDNTLITFSATRGYFTDAEGNPLGDSIMVRTVNGRASTIYNAGPIAAMGSVSARLGGASSSRDVLISPGRPANLSLRSFVYDVASGQEVEADTSSVASPNDIFMRAVLKDLYNNVCPSHSVRFTTDIGTFGNMSHQQTVSTNSDGLAQVRFTPGMLSGAATITAFANGDTLSDQLFFSISADDVHSISFTEAGQINLDVANTGGTQSAILRVKLRDLNGNVIDAPRQVFFKIVNNNPPEGANLNNVPVTEEVEVTSSGGEASVSVNSGTASGYLNIRARTVNDAGINVQASKANIVIRSGPAHTVTPFISQFNTGVSMGGGLWQIVAGAVVRDVHNNPVSYGTGVWLSIPFNPYGCQIVGGAYTGNISVNGDSLAGVAFTTLTYPGVYTHEFVTLLATTGLPNGQDLTGQSIVMLPLNQPSLEIQVVPAHLNFGQTLPASRDALIICTVVDLQGNQIRKAQILLTSNRGQFVYNNNLWYVDDLGNIAYWNSPATPFIIVTNYDGVANGTIRAFIFEIPFPDPQTNTPGQTVVNILARIMGTNVNANTTLELLRYPGAPPG